MISNYFKLKFLLVLFIMCHCLSSYSQYGTKPIVIEKDNFGIQFSSGFEVEFGDFYFFQIGAYHNIRISRNAFLSTGLGFDYSLSKKRFLGNVFTDWVDDKFISHRFCRTSDAKKIMLPIQIQNHLFNKSNLYIAASINLGYNLGETEKVMYKESEVYSIQDPKSYYLTLDETPSYIPYYGFGYPILVQNTSKVSDRIIRQYELTIGFKVLELYVEPFALLEQNHLDDFYFGGIRLRYGLSFDKSKKEE